MHFSLSKTHFHYFIIYTIISTNNYLFILTLLTSIYLAGKFAWSLDTVIAMKTTSGKTDNQFHYFGWDTVFPPVNLSSPIDFFFPPFSDPWSTSSLLITHCVSESQFQALIPVNASLPCLTPIFFPRQKFILSPWLPFTLTMWTRKCSPPKGCLKTALLCCLKSNRGTTASVPLTMVAYIV